MDTTSMTVYETVFSFLGINLYSQNTIIILICAGVSLAVSLVAGVLAGLAYYSNISALVLFAKPIEKKSDVKRTPSMTINRCVGEYMVCGENGSPLSSVDSIVMKNILKMNLLGINLRALEKLGARLEAATLMIAAAAAIITGEAGWLALIGGGFIICKIILLFFDSETLREKLFYGISTYLNREFGKFFIPDDKAGLRVFKNELHSTLMEQASILQNAINNLNSELSDVIRESYKSISKTLDGETKKYDNIGEKIKEPVENLSALFVRLERSAAQFTDGAKALTKNVSLMDEKLGAITNGLEKSAEANAKSLESSRLIFNELKDSLKPFNAAYLAIEAELSAVKDTQKALEVSLQNYELSLQQTAGQVGDAVGSIVEYRGKEAAESLNEAIGLHIKQFQSDTARLLEKMADLFEQSYEQNKSEMQTLLRIEEAVKK